MTSLDLTVIAIDTVVHGLTRKAVEDSMSVAKKAIVFSDSKEAVPEGAEWIKIEVKSNKDAELFLWYAVSYFIETSHILVVQWDGFVLRPDLFDPKWFEYDYIGSRWLDGVIGNGGFSLRSTKLMKFLRHLVFTQPEDVAICRIYRDALEQFGFKFATEDIARKFSYEREAYGGYILAPNHPVFGFHTLVNFPIFLNATKRAEREALFNSYVTSQPRFEDYVRVRDQVNIHGNPYDFAA